MADNIDITINETVENIDIVVNPNLIEVNITKIEGASVDGLVPYIGATDDVNLGSFDLTANNVNVDVINFDLNPIVPTSVGSLYWDNVNKTLSLIDKTAASVGLVSGTGTTNKLLKWGSSSTGVDSIIQDDGNILYTGGIKSSPLFGETSFVNNNLSTDIGTLYTNALFNTSVEAISSTSNTAARGLISRIAFTNSNTQNWNGGIVAIVAEAVTGGSASGTADYIVGLSLATAKMSSSMTVNNVYGIRASYLNNSSGNVPNTAGLAFPKITNSTNSTQLLLGTTTIPSGNYSIYDTTGYNSVLSGNLLVRTSTNNGNAGRFAGTVDVNKLQLNNTPATASGTPPLLTWNSTTKDVESVPYATFAPTASPTFTGTPIAPTAPAGTNTTQIATTAFVNDGLATKQNTLTNPITGTGTTNTIPKWTGTNTQGDSNLSDNGTIVTSSTDMSINGMKIGRGGGNYLNNVRIGNLALENNTNGVFNVAIGNLALENNTYGPFNVAIGSKAVNANTTGEHNIGIGDSSLRFLNGGNYNTAISSDAGRYIANKSTSNTNSSNSVFIGYRTSPLADSQTNQIVIGYDATGLGSNTSVFGNSSTTFGRWYGRLLLGTSSDNGTSALQVNGSVKIANDTTVASSANVGAIRYRSDANNSYMDMVMQTGAATYAWVNIKQNTW